jgi:hypothetical protein
MLQSLLLLTQNGCCTVQFAAEYGTKCACPETKCASQLRLCYAIRDRALARANASVCLTVCKSNELSTHAAVVCVVLYHANAATATCEKGPLH